jgi:hypothetical protein
VQRWQPVTVELAAALAEHARCRGAVLPTNALLRFRYGKALTSRRYDHLWHHIGARLPWAAAQGITTHWLRHTTLTWVERHFGYGIARSRALRWGTPPVQPERCSSAAVRVADPVPLRRWSDQSG